MKPLFAVKELDREFYEERLKGFLPDKFVDFHTHVWVAGRRQGMGDARCVSWPSLVAADNPVEDLVETYRLMFPGKEVTPLMFATVPERPDELAAMNAYVAAAARERQFPALVFSDPAWSGETLEKEILAGGFLGVKSYLSMSPAYLPRQEIRIYDFFPPAHLEVMDKHGWIMMLHIPRDGRLKDPVNLAQILEIAAKYPKLKFVVAHVGRAYCDCDLGDALERLAPAVNVNFDICANCNSFVFERLIEAVGPKRILFGSDLPILRMRTRRIQRDGRYVNLVPKGLYGDVSKDPNLGELEGAEAEKLTFFMYEEIDAFRRAAENTGLAKSDVEDVFNNNARALIDAAEKG